MKGYTGEDGRPGQPGHEGLTGPQGTNGLEGERGLTGSPGPRGLPVSTFFHEVNEDCTTQVLNNPLEYFLEWSDI